MKVFQVVLPLLALCVCVYNDTPWFINRKCYGTIRFFFFLLFGSADDGIRRSVKPNIKKKRISSSILFYFLFSTDGVNSCIRLIIIRKTGMEKNILMVHITSFCNSWTQKRNTKELCLLLVNWSFTEVWDFFWELYRTRVSFITLGTWNQSILACINFTVL